MAAGLLLLSGQLSAAEGDTISLNEKWLFKLSRNEASTPKNFAAVRFDDTQWRFMAVPGVWKVPTAWQSTDYVGVYRGWIKMHPYMQGKRIFLHLGLTTAVTDVYVNGQKIGQTSGDRAQTEFEITDRVTIGERNLFVLRMNHYDQGEDATNTRGNSGITSDCYIYVLPEGTDPAPQPRIANARNGVRVADRFSFEPEEGFFDSEKRIAEDLELMRKAGFGAVTYNKLSSDPRFIDLARKNGFDVVLDAPVTSVPLVDADRQFNDAVYAYLPDYPYDFKKVIRAGEARANAAVAKPKPRKKESDELLTVWDTPYSISFDKHTGLISSYVQNGVTVFSGSSTLRPEGQSKLVSFTATKPSKASGTKVTEVYDVENEGRSTWNYEITNNGVLKVSADAIRVVNINFSSRLSQSQYCAQGIDGPVELSQLAADRARVFWWRQKGADGKGVEVVANTAFTALRPVYKSQLLLRNPAKGIELNFLPAAN